MPFFNGSVSVSVTGTTTRNGRNTMRRTIQRAAIALVVAGVTALGGAVAMTHAEAETVPQPTTQAVIPSCSLHPTRIDAGVVFQNQDPAKAEHFLQVITEDGRLAFNATLQPGESTPTLTLTPAASIGWAGNPYPLSAYDGVNWCAEEVVTTTTTAPPPTVPPTTAPPVMTPPTTSVAPPSTTIPAPPPPVSEPPISCLDDRCELLTVASVPPATAIETGVEAAVETRAPLPNTGGHPGPLPLIGIAALLLGGVSLGLSALRRDAAAGR